MEKEEACNSYMDIINIWYNRIVVSQKCHYLASARFEKYNYYLGIPTTILSVAVGTVIIASSSKHIYSIIAFIFGIGGILAGILSSLQTFLKFNERSEKHKIYGVKYGIIGRRLEILVNTPDITYQIIDNIKLELDALANDAPKLPLDILSKVKKTTKDYEKIFGPIVDNI